MRLWTAALLVSALLAPTVDAQPQYLAFGDSITAGWGFDDCPCQCVEACGYPWRLERLFADRGEEVTVFNAGLGGEKTPGGLTRLDTVLGLGAKTLLLMEGSNDITQSISPETTLFNLREMARKAGREGLSVVHGTLIPRLPTARRDVENEETIALNWELRELAFGSRRSLVDSFEAFWRTPDRFATIYAPPVGSDGGRDPVGHPNADGFQLMAETFFDVLTGVDSMPPVLGALSPLDGTEEVSPEAAITLRLYDFGAGIDLDQTVLSLNGQPVATTILGTPQRADVAHVPTTPLSGVVTVSLRTTDGADPPNAIDERLTRFVVAGTVLLPGDLDRDGRVDGADLVLLGWVFGLRESDAGFDAAADLDGNGVVDGIDLAILAESFGKTAS